MFIDARIWKSALAPSGNVRRAASLGRHRGIAEELHDALGLNLIAVLWQLNAAEELLAHRNEDAGRECVVRARRIAADALREIRCAVETEADSAPVPVAAVLEEVVHTATCGSTAVVRFINCDQTPLVSSGMCSQIKRIVLEAVSNAVKHSDARCIDVRLSCEMYALVIVIRDDGKGFLVDRAMDDCGFGLQGMRKRADRIGAELSVISETGSGTEVRLMVPAPDADFDFPIAAQLELSKELVD